MIHIPLSLLKLAMIPEEGLSQTMGAIHVSQYMIDEGGIVS